MNEKIYISLSDFTRDLGYTDEKNYRLERINDKRLSYSEDIKWVEWEDTAFKDLHDKPEVGRSLIMSPFNAYFTWLTTPVTEIIEQSDTEIRFKTKNSEYLLTWKKD